MPIIFNQICTDNTDYKNSTVSRLNGLSNSAIQSLGTTFFEALPQSVLNSLQWSPISGWGQINALAALNIATGRNYPNLAVASPLVPNYLVNIGFDDVWAAGFTGKGVTVAVVDSGIDTNNPNVFHDISPLSKNLISNQSSDIQDSVGHGTAMAGVINASPT